MEEKTKKRGWVKDAAIIFLAVLLVLTFFSSTILNRSLPEVATVYVTDGTITTKVRGTGTVIAKENYDVTIEQSRKVQSVLVRVGDEVLAGDVLFVLQAGDSSELEALKAELENLEKSYQRELIAQSESYASEDHETEKMRKELAELQATADELALTPEEQEAYDAAVAELLEQVEAQNAALDAQQALIDAAQAEIDKLLESVEQSIWDGLDDVDAKAALLDKAQALYDAKHGVVTEKQEKLDSIAKSLEEAKAKRDSLGRGSGSTSALESASNVLNEAKEALDAAKLEVQTQYVIHGDNYNLLIKEARAMMEAKYRSTNGIAADAELTDAQKAALASFQSANLPVYLPAAAEQTENPALADAYRAITGAESAVTNAQKSYNSAMSSYDNVYYEYAQENRNNQEYQKADKTVQEVQALYDAAEAELKQAQRNEEPEQRAVEEAQKTLVDAKRDVEEAQALLNNLRNENRELFSVPLEYAKQMNELQELKTQRTALQTELDRVKGELDKLKTEREKRDTDYNDAKAKVDSQQEELEERLYLLDKERNSQLTALSWAEKREAIGAKKAEIEALTSEDGGTEVKARVAGTIQSISVSAGHEAMAGAVLATIEVPDLGYTLNFSVTNEQARRLRVGDTTSVSNYYWGSEIIAKLVSIKTDPQNPQGSKLLTFDITGDVTPGSSLSLSVGDKNANYDMVVPNSAIRSDVNGSFVLKITAKNSPLGNRYYATRVDVNVVSSDEKYSAISGAIESYDSVITTASGNAPISAGDQVRLADTNS